MHSLRSFIDLIQLRQVKQFIKRQSLSVSVTSASTNPKCKSKMRVGIPPNTCVARYFFVALIVVSIFASREGYVLGLLPSRPVVRILSRQGDIHPITLQATREGNVRGQDTRNPLSLNRSDQKKRKVPSQQFANIADVMKAIEKNPAKFISSTEMKKKKSSRTRQRVERPQQKYIYASQRRAMELLGKNKDGLKNNDDGSIAAVTEQQKEKSFNEEEKIRLDSKSIDGVEKQLRQNDSVQTLGVNQLAPQMADVIVGDSVEEIPKILGSVRLNVQEDDDGYVTDGSDIVTSNTFAYVVYKPSGWSILGGERRKQGLMRTFISNTSDENRLSASNTSTNKNYDKKFKRVNAYDEETDKFTYVEYNEADILAMLTVEEREELMKEGGLKLVDEVADEVRGVLSGADSDEDENYYDWNNDTKMRKKESTTVSAVTSVTRLNANILDSSLHRPSLVSWLKQMKAKEGTPIKGGKTWAAIAGAVEVDDSGLVLLCPRDKARYVHVNKCDYVTVVGNMKKMSSRSKLMKAMKSGCLLREGGELFEESSSRIEVISRLKTGRDHDPVSTVEVSLSGGASLSAHAVMLCQDRLGDGVRGDPSADPLNRLAARRLVHCKSMVISSLVNEKTEAYIVNAEPLLTDDIRVYSNRRNNATFFRGSYLGRQAGLAHNSYTSAYREINGAADGYPGWVVDRYDKWLFVQHEEGPMSVMGPIPSLHDGYTLGIYYLQTKPDRSIMGTANLKPRLLEGKAAPENIEIKENGITYHICLGETFSTGIFLDQRLQRAWLAQHCTNETRVLNCFAHAGAFSVAAATAGASTVSLDLNKRWLDKVRPQLEANGIFEWDGKHDCIYGDCFEWLNKLIRRNEQFDIVILDPPSTSVNKFHRHGKKRWSVKSDMDELVALATQLVKSNGLLMTSTNSASLKPEKFVKMCIKGLQDAGIQNCKLERISPMPSDFPSIGDQPVTNLVWRIP